MSPRQYATAEKRAEAHAVRRDHNRRAQIREDRRRRRQEIES